MTKIPGTPDDLMAVLQAGLSDIDVHFYETHYRELMSDPADGFFSAQLELIGIWDELRASKGVETLVHEQLHAVMEMQAIDGENFVSDEENAVLNVAKGICVLMRYNPDFWHWMIDVLAKGKTASIRDAWEKRKKRK